MDKTSSILLIAILSVTITYNVGLMDPPGCLWHDGVYEQRGGDDPILLTTRPRWCKAFFYCNSVAFLASLVIIILVRKRVRLEHQTLKAAIIVKIFGLMGANAAVIYRDTSIYIWNVMVLAVILLVQTVLNAMIYIITGGRGKIEELMVMFCVCTFSLTMFGDPTYYQDPRSEPAIYLKLLSFLMLSVVLIILLVTPNLYKRVIQYKLLFVSSLAGVMWFATCKGMTGYIEISDGIIMILVGLTILVPRSFSAENADNTADVVNDMTSRPTFRETEDGNANKWDAKDFYIVLLGVLTARVTYQAWQGSGIGNLVMHDNSRPWYLIFLYSNAFSFVASIVVVVLLLLQLQHKWCLSKVLNTVIVLDLLGLLVAHVTSSCRSLKNIACLSSLTATVLSYFVICMMLSFFDSRKTPSAPATASESN